MTSTEIAEKLSCIPEKDIELLTGMMLTAKSGDDRRLLIDMLDRVNEYAYLTENGIPLGDIAYRDFVMGNCPIDAPSPETVEQFRKTIDAAEAGDAEAQYTAAMMAMEGAVGLPDFDAGICAFNGEGTPTDRTYAMECVKTAEQLGCSDAKMLYRRMERYLEENQDAE